MPDERETAMARGSVGREAITLSKAEIAFLNALIEEMQAEESNRVEGVTLYLDSQELEARWTKVITKVTKEITKATKYTWVTEIFGDIFVSDAEMTAAQRRRAADLRGQLEGKSALDDLLELRALVEGTPQTKRGAKG